MILGKSPRRRCERSEAIQRNIAMILDCFVASLAMTVAIRPKHPALTEARTAHHTFALRALRVRVPEHRGGAVA